MAVCSFIPREGISADQEHEQGLYFLYQMPPMVLGATAASARIHLSPEIYSLQEEMQTKVEYFNRQKKELQLPLINESISPIDLSGSGKPDTGYTWSAG